MDHVNYKVIKDSLCLILDHNPDYINMFKEEKKKISVFETATSYKPVVGKVLEEK